MMSFSQIAGDAGYYSEKDNYYARGSVDSRWLGRGAEILGLCGQVNDATLDALKQGILPDGTRLSRLSGGKETHRAGYDLTFSAPKSVSVLALACGDARFIAAHDAAVSVAMQEVESLACTRITQNSRTAVVQTGSIIAALYNHDTSRALDPQLHTHALVFNATRVQEKWRTLASSTRLKNGFCETIMSSQVALGNIYRHALRREVEAMGYRTQDTGRNGLWEIEGVPVEPFSQRSRDISAAAGNDASLKSRDIAALATRRAKVAADPAILVAEWQDRLKENGFDLAAFNEQAQQNVSVRQETLTTPAPDIRQAVATALSQLSDSRMQFTGSEVLSRAVSQLPAAPGIFSQVRQEIDAAIEHQQMIPLDSDRGLFTSGQLLDCEAQAVRLTHACLKENRVLTFPEHAQESTRPQGDAFCVLGQDRSPVAILSGRGNAENQRQRIIDAVNMARAQGRDVQVLAADRNSREFLTQTPELNGIIMTRPQSTLSLPLLPQSTLVVDQAEKLTLQDTVRLLEQVRQQDIQLLLIDSQKRPGTGNALWVVKEAGAAWYRCDSGPDIHTGIVSEKDRQTRLDRLAQDYVRLQASGASVVAQAAGVREREALTACIRSRLKYSGQLGREEISLSALEPVWLDSTTRRQRDSYQQGMVMEYWDADRKTLQRFRIDRVAAAKNVLHLSDEHGEMRSEKISQLDSRWSLFREKTLSVSVGDRLKATGREYSGQIHARDVLTVTGYSDTSLTVKSQEKTMTLPLSRALKLEHGHVEEHGASMATDRTVLAVVGTRAVNAATLNQLGRSGQSVTLYTALSADKAEKRLSASPQWRPVSAAMMAQTGTQTLSQAQQKLMAQRQSPALQCLMQGIRQLEASSPAFTEVSLLAAAMDQHAAVTLNDLKAEISRQKKQGLLMNLPPSAGNGLVSRLTWEMEKSILRTIAEGKNTVAPLMENIPEPCLQGLTAGQQAATSLILQTRDRFVAIQGFAGTGKTTQFRAVMKAIDSLPADMKPQITGLAPTHRAVQEMQACGVQAQTMASFLQEEHQRLQCGEQPDYRNQLFLVDEASMTGNRDMAQLLQLTARGNGRAIISGDTAQLQAIEPGQPFRLMQQRSVIDTAVMQEIVRQTPQLKPAIEAMMAGQAREALTGVDALSPALVPREREAWQPAASVMEFRETVSDSVTEGQHNAPRTVTQAISLDYAGRTAQAREDTLIVAHLNADRQDINRQIHDLLHQKGITGSREIHFNVLEPVRMNAAERHSIRKLAAHTGDQVVMNGRHYTLSAADVQAQVITLTDPQGQESLINSSETGNLTLYRRREIKVSQGDRVRFTRTDSERGHVANSLWQISHLSEDGKMTLTDGHQTRQIDPAKTPEDAHLDLAYAVTAYGAQGASARYVIALEGTQGTRKHLATREGAYVSLSRAKEHVQIFTDDREAWLKALNRQRDSKSTHDLMGDRQQQRKEMPEPESTEAKKAVPEQPEKITDELKTAENPHKIKTDLPHEQQQQMERTIVRQIEFGD